MDKDGVWTLFSSKPRKNKFCEWVVNIDHDYIVIDSDMLEPANDWEKLVRINNG